MSSALPPFDGRRSTLESVAPSRSALDQMTDADEDDRGRNANRPHPVRSPVVDIPIPPPFVPPVIMPSVPQQTAPLRPGLERAFRDLRLLRPFVLLPDAPGGGRLAAE